MKKLATFILGLMIFTFSLANAQDRQISGKVISKDGSPLIGVQIIVDGKYNGGFTKKEGKFSINIKGEAKKLTFKLIGMKTKNVEVSKANEINVIMDENPLMTDEVVVTAIGLEQQKKSIGFATQEISGSELVQSHETNIVESFAGKIAGVQVNNSAGVAGASSYIRIRGVSSIMGENQPLFIVDGIPIDNSMNASVVDPRTDLVAGVANSNRAMDLNPDDIDSVDILKGPAATALYGIRAASGVVVITTKKGIANSPVNVTFSSSIGYDVVNKLPDLQNQYSQGSGGVYKGPVTANSRSWGAKIDTLRFVQPNANNANEIQEALWDRNGILRGPSDPRYADGKTFTPYDNVGTFFQTGMTYNNTLNIAGGGTASSYYFSMSDLRQTGVVPNNDFNRTTVRLNADNSFSDVFKATGTIAYTKSGGTRIQQGSNISGVMLGLLRTPITFDNSNGYSDPAHNPAAYSFTDVQNPSNPNRNYRGNGAAQYDNPFWTVNENPFKDNVDRVMGSAQFDYNPADWISVLYRFGTDFYTDTRNQLFSIGSRAYPTGRLFDDKLNNQIYNSDLIVTLRKELTRDIDGSLALGHNMYQESFDELRTTGDGLVVPGFNHLDNATSITTYESISELRRAAFFSRLSLNYKEMLYFNADLRNEWSTTLPEANNSFLFGGANAAFIFTEALGMKNDPILPFGRLRLAYATVGKDAPVYATTTPYTKTLFKDGWTTGIEFPFNSQPGFQLSTTLGNKDLKPEISKSFEIGTDLRFFNNRINLDLTYYNVKNTDIILLVPLSGSTGYSQREVNAGTMENHGIEIVLNAVIYQDKDFHADITFNWAKNVQKVDELAPGVDNVFIGGFTGGSVRAVAGQPYGSIYGVGFMRDVTTGKMMIDGNGFPIIDPNERSFGSSLPDWIAGSRLTLSYKGITLSALLDIKQGGVLWNGTKGALYYFGVSKDTDIRGTAKVFDGVVASQDANGNWVSTGQQNTKSVTLGQNWFSDGPGNGFSAGNTENFIEDASWVRLREVTIQYRLPLNVTTYTPFDHIDIVATARNLWLHTKYSGIDPETSLYGANNAMGIDYFNMPGTKGWTFTLKFGF